MKRIIAIWVAIGITTAILAQAPEIVSYQVIIRDASNSLVCNQVVGMRISVLEDSAEGKSVYVETQTPVTNVNGLASVQIGEGTLVSGSFSSIDWADGPYFLKTEIDPEGDTHYILTGSNQVLSVPYALHANTADSLTGSLAETDPLFVASVAYAISASDTAIWNNKQDKLTAGTGIVLDGNTISTTSSGATGFIHYIGEEYGGGVIFHLWKDSEGTEHGLVVSTTYQGIAQAWGNIGTIQIGAAAQSSWDGLSNSTAIVAQDGHTSSAAKLCLDWV
ncbi:MAG TPA: hypothetical protein PLK12_11165, partial [Prolixibacteraceae bacterium]|nr:hypothetical protein [Prolixibacteraceae bacterium]